MHELSIASNIIDIVSQSINNKENIKVDKICVSIGKLSGIVKESLLFCWEIAAKNSKLNGSKLIVKEQALVVYCESCKKKTLICGNVKLRCGRCGEPVSKIISGKELIIDKIIVNDETKDSRYKKEHAGKK